MSLTTQAQIGYTPQQMEAKFGKPKFTKNFGTKSCNAIYTLTSETAPFLVSMGAKDVNVTYYDGKAETFSGGGNFYDKAEAAGVSLIEPNPDYTLISDRKRTGTASNPEVSFNYKGYTVSVSRSEFGIAPIAGTKIAEALKKDNDLEVEELKTKGDGLPKNEFH